MLKKLNCPDCGCAFVPFKNNKLRERLISASFVCPNCGANYKGFFQYQFIKDSNKDMDLLVDFAIDYINQNQDIPPQNLFYKTINYLNRALEGYASPEKINVIAQTAFNKANSDCYEFELSDTCNGEICLKNNSNGALTYLNAGAIAQLIGVQ